MEVRALLIVKAIQGNYLLVIQILHAFLKALIPLQYLQKGVLAVGHIEQLFHAREYRLSIDLLLNLEKDIVLLTVGRFCLGNNLLEKRAVLGDHKLDD